MRVARPPLSILEKGYYLTQTSPMCMRAWERFRAPTSSLNSPVRAKLVPSPRPVRCRASVREQCRIRCKCGRGHGRLVPRPPSMSSRGQPPRTSLRARSGGALPRAPLAPARASSMSVRLGRSPKILASAAPRAARLTSILGQPGRPGQQRSLQVPRCRLPSLAS